MRVNLATEPVSKSRCDAVVVGIYEGTKLGGAAAELDRSADGVLAKLLERGELTGKPLELLPLFGLGSIAAGQVLTVGLGPREKLDRRTAFQAAAAATLNLSGKARETVGMYLADGWDDLLAEAAVAGGIVGCQGQDLYRAKKNRNPLAEIGWSGVKDDVLKRGTIIGEAVNLTRRLVDEPPDVIYPESFAAEALQIAEASGLEIEVWDEGKLKEERAGALLAVAKGSHRPPRLVILSHNGGPAAAPPLALVGKGVTFDSGGLSLKTNESMKTMKSDMAGAATVLGAMQAIARLGLPANVIGLMGLVENMPSAGAMKLGDVLHARNGRTIEVQNTDAEGRLVLADVLSVAVDRGAAPIIDLATLTGSCVVALGLDVAGLMTNDQDWCDTIAQAAADCGERAWQLPMFEEYGELVKSDVADIKNVGQGRWGGAITAAKFLEEFVANTPWTHVDIAGPAFLDKPKPWLDGGASGYFVRTLVDVVRGVGQ